MLTSRTSCLDLLFTVPERRPGPSTCLPQHSTLPVLLCLSNIVLSTLSSKSAFYPSSLQPYPTNHVLSTCPHKAHITSLILYILFTNFTQRADALTMLKRYLSAMLPTKHGNWRQTLQRQYTVLDRYHWLCVPRCSAALDEWAVIFGASSCNQ